MAADEWTRRGRGQSVPSEPPTAALREFERAVHESADERRRVHRIADDLGISENTAEFHVSNLLRKAGARNRAELAELAELAALAR